MKDYYAILDIPENATIDEIKKAYRKIAARTHPDKVQGKEQIFRDASEAYIVLKDRERKKEYDKTRKPFYPKPSQKKILTGSNLKVTLKVTRREMISGKTKTVVTSRKGPCRSCDGTGSAAKESIECSKCNGSGIELISIVLRPVKTCTLCQGSGKIPRGNYCKICQGTGIKTETIKRQIKLSPWTTGYVTIPQSGNHIRCGQPGNLLINIEIQEEPGYKVYGLNVSCSLDVSPAQAIIGDTINLDVFDRDVPLRIPPGTLNSYVLENSKGGIKWGRKTGTLTAKVHIKIPRKINEKQRELYKKLLETEKEILNGQL